jgi:hypothetical protein
VTAVSPDVMDWSGFEPETSGLQNRRSSGLIYQPTSRQGGARVISFPKNRAPGANRRNDRAAPGPTNHFYPPPVLAA